ncbi:MAG: acetate--CoA ligase family protein, partial [Desulfitobacteriaceae bacterium]|nr:acetate--CoA ligase family protein [Desulfitobacteriaceae bacterium]
DVRTNFEEIMKKAKVYAPRARIQGVLIQEEVPSGVEVIVGLQKDPVLGSQILFGLGGIFVEVLQDAVLRPLPLRRQEARAMLNEIKGAAMLNGVRGYPPVDKEALVDILMGVSQLAGEAEDQILSLDLNPVAVLPQGQGAKVLDGVLVKSPGYGYEGGF